MEERKRTTEETLGQSGAVALFDVDQTLIKGYTIFPFVDMLVDQGIVHKSISAALKDDRLRHDNGETTYQDFADNVVTHYCQGLEGKSQRDVEAIGKLFLVHIESEMLCGFSTDLVKMMNEQAQTIAISGSPVEVLRPLADHLHIAEVCGLEAEVSNGYYTGRVKTNMAVSGEKEKQITSLKVSGYSTKTSFAFGDSDSDIPILEAVANPFAVTPNQALREIAEKRGWEIVNSENILPRVKARLARLQPIK